MVFEAAVVGGLMRYADARGRMAESTVSFEKVRTIILAINVAENYQEVPEALIVR